MATQPPRRKQHLVSKGYQRNFADGNRVAIVDVRTADIVDPRRSIQENWVQLDFLSVKSALAEIDDSLELEFSKHERRVLNIIRGISN